MGLDSSKLDSVRSALDGNLPWSPLDFIRGINKETDEALHLETLTAEIRKENDLRGIYTLADGSQIVVFAEKLEWDSEFFGYGIGRINGVFPLEAPYFRPHADYSMALTSFIEDAKDAGIVYLFTKLDPRDLATIRALGELGFSLLVTNLYQYINIKDFNYSRRHPTRKANRNDIDSLGRAAVEMVNIFDRFRADPFLNQKDVDRLMYRWIEASIHESFADFLLVPDFPQPEAFIACKNHEDKWPKRGQRIAQITIAAVSPEYRGWLRKLVAEYLFDLRNLEIDFVYHTTQITNRAVIRATESIGYQAGNGEQIFRKILV